MHSRLMVVFAAAGLCAAQNKPAAKNPFGADAAAVETGRIAFRVNCAGCHGLRAKGGRSGPDLTSGQYAAGDTDADLYRVISSGVPGTEMPNFGQRLEEDDLWRLISYLRSIAQTQHEPVAGDRAAGEKLFWGKGSCGQCHRVGTRGNAIGPALTRAGRQRSLAYLRESIVSPDADVTPGYATINVVTRDGKKITGVEKGFDNFSAQFIDLSGRYYSFFKDDVTSLQREYRSLMPSNYGQLFDRRELDDLLAYVASLGVER